MILDALVFDDRLNLEADLCIVGAGPTGIALAREFANSGTQVLLMDSGSFEVDAITQSLNDEVFEGDTPTGSKYLYSSRMRMLGGTSAIWGGRSRPLNAADFTKRDWIAHSGWGISRAELELFYERAKEAMQLSHISTLAKEEDPRVSKLPFAEGSSLVSSVFHFKALRFGEYYRQFLQNSQNIRTVLNANAIDIALASNAQSVTNITFKTIAKKTFTVRARRYIIAAGGIENARLLLASNKITRTGVGNQNDQVGRYFMEHPVTELGFISLWSTEKQAEHLKIAARHEPRDFQVFLSPTAEAQANHRILNFAIEYLATPPAFLPKKDLNLLAASQSLCAPHEHSPLNAPFQVLSEQAPNPESRVELDSEKNALDERKAKVTWKLLDIDYRTIKKSFDLLAAELGRAHLGRVQFKHNSIAEIESFSKGRNGVPPGFIVPAHHHMGTTRMHSDPRQGVVDRDCKVHGIANLFIAGSSVFTTSGVANPTYTAVALAIRLAEHLKKLGSQSA